MCQQRNNTSSTVKNQGNMVSQKENGNCPETKLKVIKNWDLNNKEFKISHQETKWDRRRNPEEQFNELGNKIKEQEDNIKETETVKENWIEILELKNLIKEMKNELL